MNILIISSLSPYKSANYGKRLIDVFREAGYSVDYLTKFKFEGMTEGMYSVFDEMEPEIPQIPVTSKTSFKYYLFARFPFIRHHFEKKNVSQSVIPLSEENPEVDAYALCQKIRKQYDVVLVTFWQYMLTTKTLQLIYEKLHVPIFLSTVDMYPMTGGCYYFNDCVNYQKECIECPAASLFEKPDIPHKNYIFKKQVYNSINCIYLCNEWMKSKVIDSKIIPQYKIKELMGSATPTFLLNDNKTDLRRELGFTDNCFIIFAGAANVRIRRKGFYELVNAVNSFTHMVKGRRKVTLVLAGRNDEDFQKYFKCKVVHVGFLSTDKLARMYRAADLYLSPSIDDAGPSMVVQSLLSGTPVVAFNIGIAPQAIEHCQTGYIAKLGDVKDLAKGIYYIYNLNDEERRQISYRCRETTVSKRNPKSYIATFEKIYYEFKDIQQ